MRRGDGMSIIVKTASGWIRGLILLYGLHVVLYGHLSPGGGFCGGVLIAAAFALVLLAEGHRSPLVVRTHRMAERLESIAALAFLTVAAVGLWVSGTFFDNFIATPRARWFALNSSGTILLSNIAVGLKVGSGVAVTLAALAAGRIAQRHPDPTTSPPEGPR